MIRTSLSRAAAVAALVLLLAPASASAQSKPEYLKFPTAKGALYRPDSGPAPHVGVVVMHRTADYLNHPSCTEMSKRGFLMLCMNTRYENNETMVNFERLPLDVKAGVEYLRKVPGITKVLLFAHSGGGWSHTVTADKFCANTQRIEVAGTGMVCRLGNFTRVN